MNDPSPNRPLTLARIAIVAIAATPLVLFPHFFFPFVTTRNVYFRLCVEAALAALLLAGVKLRVLNAREDIVLRWLGIYVGALMVSAVAGLAPRHSFFGDFERMGGVVAWLHLFLFCFLLRTVLRERDWVFLLRVLFIAADVVVLWGALAMLPISIGNPLFHMTLDAGSTTGNQGLLAPYLVLTSALAMWDAYTARSRLWRFIAGVSVAILLLGVAGSRNRSSELGLLVGLAAAACVFVYYSANRRGKAIRLGVIALASVTLFAFAAETINARAPGVGDYVGGRWKGFFASPVDHARTMEWKIALDGFRDRPLLGYGPENHQIVASHHFDPRVYDLGETIFDRAHNAWLEALATTGLLGALALAGIWLAAISTLRRGARAGSLSAGEAAIVSGALAAYATYLTFWFFDINSVVVWVVLLGFLSSRVNGAIDVDASRQERRTGPLTLATVGLVVVVAYTQGIVSLRAAHDLSSAIAAGPFDERLSTFEKVLDSSAPQTLHTFPLYYRLLRDAEPQMSGGGASPSLRRQFDVAMRRGVVEADRSIARSSNDDRSYVEAARFFSLAGAHYSNLEYVRRAKSELLMAVRISPSRADSRVLLSGVYLTLGDTAAAAAQLDSAMFLAPQFLPAFFAASRLELARGHADSSASLLSRTVAVRAMQH